MRSFSLIFVTVWLTLSAVQAQVVRPVIEFADENVDSYAVMDDAGTVVYATSTGNPYGTNPQHRQQIFRWDPVSGAGAQVTNFEEGVETVSVSDDGEWLAFVSNGDLTGANHDESPELFVMRQDGSDLAQLTSDPGSASFGVEGAAISGSANRLVFIADIDPLGTNPGRESRLFSVNRDGTGMIQVGDAPYAPYASIPEKLGISDDGTRIAFLTTGTNGRPQVFAVQHDGTNLRELTAAAFGVFGLALSGDGGRIAFYTGDIGVVNWDGTGLLPAIVTGVDSYLSITDDGQMIVYQPTSVPPAYVDSVWKVQPDGTGATQLFACPSPLYCSYAMVSGGGTRITFTNGGGAIPGGSNPDGEIELNAMDGSGAGLRQLTALGAGSSATGDPEILPDGTRIYFQSADDLVGSNPDVFAEVFTVLRNGTGLAQVTPAGSGSKDYSVSDAGLVVFVTSADPTGQNACERDQIFKINTNGTGLAQVTNNCAGLGGIIRDPEVRPDGQWVIFQSTMRVGSNSDGSGELFKISTSGTGLAPLTADNDGLIKTYSFSESATTTAWITYSSGSNTDGLNPDGGWEVFRIRLDGLGLQRLTQDPAPYGSHDPDISGNGLRIVWESDGDPLGTNADHSTEIFLYDAATGTKRQLTNSSGSVQGPARITRDGLWVYYFDDGDLVRLAVATGVVERVSGFGHNTSGIGRPPAFDRTGTRAVFLGRDIVDRSPSTYSPFIVDQTVKPLIQVGKPAPTVVTWDADSESARYDVIRGDVAGLAPGPGSTVDLGPVVCLEDDSPDNHTRGFEDATQPAPGQVFFYLYRGALGLAQTAGSWGQGSGAKERTAGPGGCGN